MVKMRYLLSPQIETGAITALKSVAGILIMSPVMMRAFGFSPQKNREYRPHILIELRPENFLTGFLISSMSCPSISYIDIYRKS